MAASMHETLPLMKKAGANAFVTGNAGIQTPTGQCGWCAGVERYPKWKGGMLPPLHY
jgi:hypothetical protein